MTSPLHRTVAVALLAWLVRPTLGPAQTLSPPTVLGRLVGPGSTPLPTGVRVYGNDLGWSFEHAGKLQMLFGDTSATDNYPCEPEPLQDDAFATLPLASAPGIPPITFATAPSDPTTFAPITIRRGTDSLLMGYGQVPLTGFSDGTDAYGVFGRFEYVRCPARGKNRPCKGHPGLVCSRDVGTCSGGALRIPSLCTLATGAGCLPGSTCEASDSAFCVDPSSSLADGSAENARLIVAHDQEIGVQAADQPTAFTSIGRFATNKFINLSSRTVACFTGASSGNAYGAGHGAVLMWGRPAFAAEKGRQAQLYLMAHRLPIRRTARGAMRFAPRFFAGLRRSGEPRWSANQARAVPLAMDGVAGGSPHEERIVLMHMSFAWLGAPVNKWIMLYGGDLASYLLEDPANAQPGSDPGAIRARFADHPWGPWSPPIAALAPGTPAVTGALYGPDGWMFHPQCVDQPPALCAVSDPHRPLDSVFAGCPQIGNMIDTGKLYAPGIIDPYTRADGKGGIEISWNVSAWNPYGVLFVRSTVTPAAPQAAKRAGRGAGGGPFRWCAE